MNTIGERIRMVRRGRSRNDFADKLGVSAQTLKRYEGGDRTPSNDFITALAEQEGVSLTWLLKGEGNIFGADSDKNGTEANPGGHSGAVTTDAMMRENEALREIVALQRENAALLRENGELRLHVERVEARNAELERQLAEALKPAQSAPMGGGISKVG